jgi:hypothetical protein
MSRLEACTGWLFVCDALVAAGAVAHLAEPVETRALRGRKRRAKTDREDTRWLRELLTDGRLPEAWIPPEHVRQWRSRARMRHTLPAAARGDAPPSAESNHCVFSRSDGVPRATTVAPRVQRLEDALDRAALAGGIAPLEEQHHALARLLDPILELDQLEVQPGELRLVFLALELS